jgi:hypothetical protein
LLTDKIDNAFISDVIKEIDILANHYWVDYCCVEKILVNYIDDSQIDILILGSLEIIHQYGSDRDYISVDGTRFENSYSFAVPVIIDVKTPLDIFINPEDIVVDNSNFYK